MTTIDTEMLVLAALLHDIGKFAQRAGQPKNIQMTGEYCPTNKHGRPSHLHVLHTDHFIEHRLPLPAGFDDRSRARLARLASAHHKPAGDDLMEMALSVADRLSAGTDRKSGEESPGDYKSARLLSVFEQLSFSGERSLEALQKGTCHCLVPLSADPYPVSLDQARQTNYTDLFKQFEAALGKLPLDMDVPHYIAALTSLLEEYTWCIPSSTYKSLADISLYDHAVTTAAIAQALAVYHAYQGGMPGEAPGSAVKFRLLGGDLSGIQAYIFKLDKSHGSGIAKLFRARSFFLQALTRSVVNALLGRLELHPAARIMDAGGRFVLLLPATKAVEDQLPEFELEVQRYFFDQFRGELSLNLSWEVQLTEDDLKMKLFRLHLDTFNDALERRKLNKFDRLLATGQSPVIDLDYEAYQEGDCAVCHARPVTPGAGNDMKLCRECLDQIERIGARLPRTEYLVFDTDDSSGIKLFDGLHLRLEHTLDPTRDRHAVELVAIHQRGRAAYMPVAAHLPTIAEEDVAQWKAWGELKTAVDGTFWMADERITVGEAKTFNLLARSARELDKEKQPVGRSFLGAFKADVDNLGLLFSIGLQKRLSISRFASLSRMINHFFSDELVRWLKVEHPDLYVVFAGGDDLFLIGPWRQLVLFSSALNQCFRAYVAQRPEVTLSAGIAVTKPSLPVHAIAAQAEELLERAKHRRVPVEKNGVTLFDTTVGWDDLDKLLGWGNWFHKEVSAERLPHSLVNRLMYYGSKRRAFLAGDINSGIYISHMAYDFARNINPKTIGDPDELAAVMGIQQDDFLLEHIRLPVTWALYRLRKDN